MKKGKKSTKDKIGQFVFITLIVSIIYIVVRIFFAPAGAVDGALGVHMKSDYVLMLIQCILGLIAFMLPTMIEHRINIVMPNNMLIMYFVFLYCAIYLGEVRSFYYMVPHWDTILHTFSGGMLGALGFTLVLLLNDIEIARVELSPLFVAMFAFCFAVTLGVFWEIYEYTFDGLLGLNMQKFLLVDGTQLIGHAALGDTMKDLMVDILGAFIIASLGYLSLKKDWSWITKFSFSKQQKEIV